MKALLRFLKRLFGINEKEPPRDTITRPSAGTGGAVDDGTSSGTGRVPDEQPTQPTSPAPAPAPAPSPVPVPVPAPTTPDRLDRLFVDGQEVDSYVVPETNVVVKTQLDPVRARRGQEYRLNLVVTAEPLADPADRKKLKDALMQIAPHSLFLGAHHLLVNAWPYTAKGILMSAPKITTSGGECSYHIEEKGPAHLHVALYFYGDKPMEIEIEIPWNITNDDIPEWAWTAFMIDWNPRRLPGETANEGEYAEKYVEVVG